MKNLASAPSAAIRLPRLEDSFYVPDERIVFSSTREPKYNQCSRDHGANLFCMEPDGANIRQISKNNLLGASDAQFGEEMGIYLIDVFGNELLLHAEEPGCYDPLPLRPQPRPPVIPPRRDFENREGYFYVADVYHGTHMAGVPRGSVKSLRVVYVYRPATETLDDFAVQGTKADRFSLPTSVHDGCQFQSGLSRRALTPFSRSFAAPVPDGFT